MVTSTEQLRWLDFRVSNYYCFKNSEQEDRKKFQRCRLGFIPGCALIVGIMIGGGIFICPGKLLTLCGSVGMSLVVWYLSGVICLCGALSYVELNSIYSKTGGEHTYLMSVFGHVHPYFGPLPAFLFQWFAILMIRPACLAINALSASEYIQQMKPREKFDSPHNVILLAIMFLGFITFLNCKSARTGTVIQMLLTFVKISILAVIIGGGIFTVYRGNIGSLKDGFQGTTTNPASLALAFYNGLLGYDGWSSLNYCTDILENPSTTLPPSVIVSVVLTTLVFLLINASYFVALTPAVIKSSSALVMTWAEAVMPSMVFVVPMGVVISILTAANGTLLVTARLCLASAKEKHMPSVFGMFHRGTGAPLPALILVSGSSIIFCLVNDVHLLIELFTFTVWIFYGMTFLSLIIIRWRHPDSRHSFRNPIVIPYIALLSSIFLVIVPIVERPNIIFVCAGYFLVGIVYYTIFVFYKKKSKFYRISDILIYCLNLVAYSDIFESETAAGGQLQKKYDMKQSSAATDIEQSSRPKEYRSTTDRKSHKA